MSQKVLFSHSDIYIKTYSFKSSGLKDWIHDSLLWFKLHWCIFSNWTCFSWAHDVDLLCTSLLAIFVANTFNVCLSAVRSFDNTVWFLNSQKHELSLLLAFWLFRKFVSSYCFKRLLSFIIHIDSPTIAHIHTNENNTRMALGSKDAVVVCLWLHIRFCCNSKCT